MDRYQLAHVELVQELRFQPAKGLLLGGVAHLHEELGERLSHLDLRLTAGRPSQRGEAHHQPHRVVERLVYQRRV